MKIINKQPFGFLQNLKKSYTEGVYVDTSQNRKLGRVGMTYSQYMNKIKEKEDENIFSNLKKNSSEGETWYEGTVKGKRVRILQEKVGSNKYWNLEIDSKFVKNSDGKTMSFESIKDAADMAREELGVDARSWNKLESSFYEKGTKENKLWNSWYKFQKTNDPSHMSSFCSILSEMFPTLTWSQTSPNMKDYGRITAKNGDKEIGSFNLSGKETKLTDLQTFLDKCFDENGKK